MQPAITPPERLQKVTGGLLGALLGSEEAGQFALGGGQLRDTMDVD